MCRRLDIQRACGHAFAKSLHGSTGSGGSSGSGSSGSGTTGSADLAVVAHVVVHWETASVDLEGGHHVSARHVDVGGLVPQRGGPEGTPGAKLQVGASTKTSRSTRRVVSFNCWMA